MTLKLILHIRKKEGFVSLDRTAYRSTEFIQIELFRGGRKKTARVQLGVAEEFKECAVNRISAGFRTDKDCWACPRAPFCGVVIRKNLELLDGIDRRKNGNAACC